MASYQKSEENIENGDSTGIVYRQAPAQKSLLVAYLLWFPLGFLGLHRLYLGYWFMGIVYMFTLGYFGIGWIVDGFCMSSMVNETNTWLDYDVNHPSRSSYGHCSEAGMRYSAHGGSCNNVVLRWRSLRDARILTFSPFGIIGIHRQYLGRGWYRLAYNLTGGLFLVGWISDMFRVSSLVRQCNAEIELLRSGVSMTEMKRQDTWDCKTSQAYIFGIPIGIFGAHHFYLGRYGFGFLYLFTFGLFGFGWLADLLRMKTLVERSNRERKDIYDYERNFKHIDDAYILGIPLGFLGAHRFYLNDSRWGVIYLCTAGLFGIGWLIDVLQMSRLVEEANLRVQQSVHVFHFPGNTQYGQHGQYYSGNTPYTVTAPVTGHPNGYVSGHQSTGGEYPPPSYNQTVSDSINHQSYPT